MRAAILQYLGLLFLLLSTSCYHPTYLQKMGELHALQGRWQTSEGTLFEEHWSVVNDSILSGMGMSKYGADTVFKESLRIFIRRDSIFYAANVEGNDREVVFLLEETRKGTYWKFVNPDHDYPNVIEYQLLDDSTLKTTTSTMTGKKEKIFLMKKIK